MSTHTDTLKALQAVAITLAGDDYRWTHADAPSTINSAHRQGMVAILSEHQNYTCAACGDRFGLETVQLCHVVASRVSDNGIMGGNVYVGHVGCNSDDAKVFGNGAIPIESFERADLIATSLPTRAACIERSHAIKVQREARRNRRIARIA